MIERARTRFPKIGQICLLSKVSVSLVSLQLYIHVNVQIIKTCRFLDLLHIALQTLIFSTERPPPPPFRESPSPASVALRVKEYFPSRNTFRAVLLGSLV